MGKVSFRWLAHSFACGFARSACTVCAGTVGKVNFIDPIIWKDSIDKYGDKKGRQVAQRAIVKAWKAHMTEVHPERFALVKKYRWTS